MNNILFYQAQISKFAAVISGSAAVPYRSAPVRR